MVIKRMRQSQFDIVIGTVAKREDFTNLLTQCIVKRIKSTSNPFCKNPVVILADPFLFVQEDRLYLFYEEQVNLHGKGVIKMVSTLNLKSWTEPKVVLEEPFHLSYPNVFVYKGEVYMLPETGHAGEVRLYKGNRDLTSWKYCCSLLGGGSNYVDSDILQVEGKLFLFTTVMTGPKTYELRVYVSQDLFGEWKEHPLSPVASDVDRARCGGRALRIGGELFRPVQACGEQYGGGLSLFRVKIDEEHYEESFYKTLMPLRKSYYRHGGHHFTFVDFGDSYVVATDALVYRYNAYEIVRRIKNKL